MTANIPQWYITQYATNIQLLLQQKGSLLEGLVNAGSHKGEAASPVDQIGAVSMQPAGAKFSPLGRVDAPVDRRWVYPSDFELPQLVDSFDELKIVLDPKGKLVENAAFAAGRQKDDLLISAFFDDAKTGKNGGTTTSFLAGNQVAVNFGAAANTGLTVAKLREAKRLLLKNQVDYKNDKIVAVVTAKQHDDLLAEAQIINMDYNERPVLSEGLVQRFLGIEFVICERLNVDGSSYRRIPVFARSGMHLGIWGGISTNMSQRTDLTSQPWQAYMKMSMGATRLEEKKVVEIKCSEA